MQYWVLRCLHLLWYLQNSVQGVDCMNRNYNWNWKCHYCGCHQITNRKSHLYCYRKSKLEPNRYTNFSFSSIPESVHSYITLSLNQIPLFTTNPYCQRHYRSLFISLLNLLQHDNFLRTTTKLYPPWRHIGPSGKNARLNKEIRLCVIIIIRNK